MKKIMTVISMVCAAAMFVTGCATPLGKKLNQDLAQRIDLGDGLVLDVLPTSPAIAALKTANPAAGNVADQIEKQLAAKRMAKLGPFDGLPYTTTRSVILKNGTVITEAEIAKIVETLTPIVPAAVTRVIEPSQFGTQPVSTAPAGNAEATTAPPDPNAVGDLLNQIGGGL